ncbi:MAG: hypothetical protein AAFZ07_09450 [Actinomycetota bacterium]
MVVDVVDEADHLRRMARLQLLDDRADRWNAGLVADEEMAGRGGGRLVGRSWTPERDVIADPCLRRPARYAAAVTVQEDPQMSSPSSGRRRRVVYVAPTGC